MPLADMQSPGSETSSSADAGLRCPQCEYNLTGLTENRCPECGTPFDPDALLQAMEGAIRPIPGWDDPGESPVRRLLSVCEMTMFEPEKFGRRFPLHCDVVSVREFWWFVRLASLGPAGALVILSALLSTSSEVALKLIATSSITALLLSLGSLACEAFLTLLLNSMAKPRIGMSSYSWSSFVVLYGGFLFVNTNACLVLWLVANLLGRQDDWWRIVGMAEAVLVCWWWYALARGVVARSQRSWNLVLAVLCIPLAVVVAFLFFVVMPVACAQAILR